MRTRQPTEMEQLYLAILAAVAFDNGFVVSCGVFLTVDKGEVLLAQLTNENTGKIGYITDVTSIVKKKKYKKSVR